MMGVFGMLAVALMVFALRQCSTAEEWAKVEKYVRLSFWGLNAGLALMVVSNLFPLGVLQLLDVLENGYWHAGAGLLDAGTDSGDGVGAVAGGWVFNGLGWRRQSLPGA